MDTLYQIGFKSGGAVTMALKAPQAFIDALVSSLKQAPQAQITWYGEPGALFQINEIQYVLPDAAIQAKRTRNYEALRDARKRMEVAKEGIATAAHDCAWVAFEVHNDAFDKAVRDFDVEFNKLAAG